LGTGKAPQNEGDDVSWYWNMVAGASSFMILGGFLMLPVTFETNAPNLRIPEGPAAVGIFAAAIAAAGLSFTVLLCFVVRDQLFQIQSIFLPAFTASALGLLSILYHFLIFQDRYTWNTPAFLATAVAIVSIITYATAVIWRKRSLRRLNRRSRDSRASGSRGVTAGDRDMPLQPLRHDSESTLWTNNPNNNNNNTNNNNNNNTTTTLLPPESTYYQNYNRNMFPSAYTDPPPPTTITEEDMQRQQMLMLLLTKPENPTTPDPSNASTFHIDWQGRDDDDPSSAAVVSPPTATSHPPPGGWYAPPREGETSACPTPLSAYPPASAISARPGVVRQLTAGELKPWDGVWREVRRPESREMRRREIEMGGGGGSGSGSGNVGVGAGAGAGAGAGGSWA
jgi:hypothetical protein